jgi:GT2 family glycosyltransferase
MKTNVDANISVIVPNWNGRDTLGACLDSLQSQTLKNHIIVVENASSDDSLEFIRENYPDVEVLNQSKNLGFAGGVNAGIRRAMELDYEFVALFNNDAVADKYWLEKLAETLKKSPKTGIATCKLLDSTGKKIDSTGDIYTVWGLPFPRGRGEPASDKYDSNEIIFGASGGASLYRTKMLEQIGLFDEDFFAYYEDVDISFRAQLAGWKILYEPDAVAYHQIGATSGKIKGFATYQTMKNLQLLFFKNVPRRFLWQVGWRFTLTHTLFLISAIKSGNGWTALKGDLEGSRLLLKKFGERREIQKSRKISDEYFWSIVVHDLPPNAKKLRQLRATWWKATGRKA